MMSLTSTKSSGDRVKLWKSPSTLVSTAIRKGSEMGRGEKYEFIEYALAMRAVFFFFFFFLIKVTYC